MAELIEYTLSIYFCSNCKENYILMEPQTMVGKRCCNCGEKFEEVID